MNVIVTGASGLLGRAVVTEFKENSWKVLGLALTRATRDLICVDITNTAEVSKIVKEYKPHAIIHCAAQRSPDLCEDNPDEFFNINVTAPKELAKLADEVKAVFVFISSDYVFNGINPPFGETTLPTPVQEYGIHKVEAERAVKKANSDSIILRIPVLYGGEQYEGESAISSLIKFIKLDRQVEVCNYNLRYPSHTKDVAKIVYQLVQRKREIGNIGGIVFQWCGSEQFTKYSMATVIAQTFNRPHDHLVPMDLPAFGVTPRPRDCLMSRQRLEHLGIGNHTTFAEGIQEFARFFH